MTRFRAGGHLSSRAGKTPLDNHLERQRDIRRQISHHVGKLGALGFEVTLCRRPEPDPDQTGTTRAA